ncbi:DinB family protein [Yeosuana sp. MJ-SS3]|uniref:DinB family protein n=1 Tax=Gilvirhabdus luticola TaxID=3079858 RepID=A0ABU3U6X5_9FLAO|nr:DinB family protein [Yeosuana sp. MJ-SS3]MDU8886159.1 DinB family protein [Yeosuana sp. MJ-SS3]
MNSSKLPTREYLPYYSSYIGKANCSDLINGLEDSLGNTLSFFNSIPNEKFEYQYSEGKWTIKEIIQHIIDAERVFTYRALCFAREDKTPLPSFDENNYAKVCKANSRSVKSLINEYAASRKSTILLFKSFSDDTLKNIGVASGGEMSVRAIAFVIVGHEKHHVDIIKERYL